jgi:hypothetical protein
MAVPPMRCSEKAEMHSLIAKITDSGGVVFMQCAD